MNYQDNIFFKTFITILGSFLIAFAFNVFLLSNDVLSSGIGGLALLLNKLLHVDAGLLNLLLNLPLLVLGFMKLKKSVMYNTVLSVGVVSFFLTVIPAKSIADELFVNVIFGGVIVGIGVGIILKYSGTTGGMDIVAMIISQNSNISIGLIMTILNGIIVLCSGFLFDWNLALMTLLSIYITGKAVDTIFTSNIKLTVNIITTNYEGVRAGLVKEIYRGITVTDVYGGYSNDQKHMITMVLTRYELQNVIKIAKANDENCFINVYETTEVHGNFARNN
ncbi:YitT family protein [Macrococcoides caseolyticum]|uniref:YitT family protein n=1 Tax=Macrococcoides caseolyticum TaxID=69966 RepID=UPI001F26E909|nr:YitT family protein [Macrococcus caseolyticus]MCE4956519.1 YitT family protein [Macrococcus caseolyticus]